MATNYEKMFTCFLGTDVKSFITQMYCIENNGTYQDQEQIVRKHMHPTDDVKHTLWLFDSKTKYFMYCSDNDKNGINKNEINKNEKQWKEQIKREEQFNGPISFEKL